MRWPHAMWFWLLGSTVLAGCGLMPQPMVPRLDEKQQNEVTGDWEAMLAPVDRLDRQMLLDVLIFNQFQQMGVDRAGYRAEKAYSVGHIVMEVYFDCAQPQADRFVVEIFDRDWKLVRRESYNRQDVEQTGKSLYNARAAPVEDENGRVIWQHPEDATRWEAWQKRLGAIRAATQPARP